MKFSTTTVACTVAAAVLSSSAMAAPYGETFRGEGTYYGDIPIGSGNCAMRGDLSVVSISVLYVGLCSKQHRFYDPVQRQGNDYLGIEARGRDP